MMQEIIMEYLKTVNIIELISIGGMFWIFYSRLNKKIDGIRSDVNLVDKRLCRIEGILHAQDCCAIKSANELRKAE